MSSLLGLMSATAVLWVEMVPCYFVLVLIPDISNNEYSITEEDIETMFRIRSRVEKVYVNEKFYKEFFLIF